MSGKVKVVLPLDPDESGVAVESPWATPLGSELYRLENIPFFFDGISLGDIFEARPRSNDARPCLTRIVKKSGNRTVRVLAGKPYDESTETKAVIGSLKELGCGVEGDGKRFFVVNVPLRLISIWSANSSGCARWSGSRPTHLHTHHKKSPADSWASV